MASRLIDKQVIFDGRKVRLEIHHLEDDEGRRHNVEVVAHPGAVVILPIVDNQTILLIRNRRYATGQILLELPAGTLEKGEDPINCAGRELQEETGYLAGRLQIVGSFFSSPGILSEKMYAFAAYDLQKTRQALEHGEEIEVQKTPLDEAIEWTRTGQIADAKTIATILLYDRFFRAKL
ncbi:MAG TPA: NUDIX hydrolase [Tepidisphaeraceae bacterium]|jgi:ADP-ribose pyrophosphatase|nr:NUDIX hydrolase [Tepidisphaeraceae bacterium]